MFAGGEQLKSSGVVAEVIHDKNSLKLFPRLSLQMKNRRRVGVR